MLSHEEKTLIIKAISDMPDVTELYLDDSDAMFLINVSNGISCLSNAMELIDTLQSILNRNVVIKLLERRRGYYEITLLL